MNKNSSYRQIVTQFPLRPIRFTGNLISLTKELTCEEVLEKFNEFMKMNGYIGGLDSLHDSEYGKNIYPIYYYPKDLYHYTNISTLSLILKNKTIMLNNLCNVDDLNEGKTRDFSDLGKYCFASCWTEQSQESIPFWNMYTDKMRGVRIKLKVNPFKKSNFDLKEINSNMQNIESEGIMEITYPGNIVCNDKFMPLPPYDNILKKVIYTNDADLLDPQLYKKFYNGEVLRLNELGRYKRAEWEFQKEWRYIVIVSPVGMEEVQDLDSKWFDVAVERYKNKVDIGINSIFLEIEDDAFKNMEIVLGPMANEEDKRLVETLLSEYNPSVNLKESVLKGQINVR